jgi:hypothetical protein
MVLLYNMYAVLSAEIGSAAQFAEAARGWLTGALAEVFPALHDSVCADQDAERPETGRNPPVTGESRRQAGHVVGTLTINPEDSVFGGRELDYSSQGWLRFLSQLGNYPAAVSVDLGLVDDHGDPLHGAAYIRVERDSESPEWASFMFTARAEDTGWPESAQVQARCAEFVKTQAARIGAVWGGMTDDVAPPDTALQRATFNPFAQVPDSRKVLRGYSWVTVVAPELAGRLGGAEVLQASRAFCDVTALPNGALWLRATPTINEFTGDRARLVFKALAPMLVTGVARFRIPGETYRIAEGVDAADYQ